MQKIELFQRQRMRWYIGREVNYLALLESLPQKHSNTSAHSNTHFQYLVPNTEYGFKLLV